MRKRQTSLFVGIFALLVAAYATFFVETSNSAEPTSFRAEFQSPPPGFGEVPFWWWTGEKLNLDKLLWQVEELHKKGISGVQINYAHQDTEGWPTYPSDPPIFSEEWFAVFDKVAQACRDRRMGIGMSGYTVDWQGCPTNLWAKLIFSDPEMNSRTLIVPVRQNLTSGDSFQTTLATDFDQTFVAAVFYPKNAESVLETERKIILDAPNVAGGKRAAGDVSVSWTATENGELWLYFAKREPETQNPLHPESGRRVIDRFFQAFENRIVESNESENQNAGAGESGNRNVGLNRPVPAAESGLNYFFQDELRLGTGPLTWFDDVPAEFERRKGYSFWEAVPAMFDASCGKRTEKFRLDFMDVRVGLAEERYFIPIFDWHNSRGMIYACDPASRGTNPAEDGDYFRVHRWYSAPGHDTPGGKADFVKNKVSSSIAHFYGRPRVWLEGYHSFGWGATPEQLMFATNENFLFGANLLNLHGLYYSTFGGFWEWAPPCYHFRMPYWEHFGTFLKYFERLSYATSQGVRQADVVVLYPVSPFQAGLDGANAKEIAFDAARRIFDGGRDVLFIDDESVAASATETGTLTVAGASHRALILPAVEAIRWATLQKALEFFRAGGTIVAIDRLPFVSDRDGRDDPELDRAVREIFGLTETERRDGKTPTIRRNANGGLGVLITAQTSFAESSETPSVPETRDLTVASDSDSTANVPAGANASEQTAADLSNATDSAGASRISSDASDSQTTSLVRTYSGGFQGRWVWSVELARDVFFKAVLDDRFVEGSYRALFFCDNSGALFLNGKPICSGVDYLDGWRGELDLKPGDVLTIDAQDADSPRRGSAGMFFALTFDEKTCLTTTDFRYALEKSNDWATSPETESLAVVDPENVHVLHRTGVNSESKDGNSIANRNQPLDADSMKLRWSKFAEILDRRLSFDVFNQTTGSGIPVLHRRTETQDVYFLMRANRGDVLSFRATGKAELLNPWTGEIRPILDAFRSSRSFDGRSFETVSFRYPFGEREGALILFSPDEPPSAFSAFETNLDEIVRLDCDDENGLTVEGFGATPGEKFVAVETERGKRVARGIASEKLPALNVEGSWNFRLEPTLDNRFGDFRLPATEENRLIGAEVQRFDYLEIPSPGYRKSSFAFETADEIEAGFDGATSVLCGFGQKFWKLGPLPPETASDSFARELMSSLTWGGLPSRPVRIGERDYFWTPYSFSWRWGIEGNPGRQGYHGLKERLDDRFIGLGAAGSALNETTFVPENDGSVYYLWTTVPLERKRKDSDDRSSYEIYFDRPDAPQSGTAPDSFYFGGEPIDLTRRNAFCLSEYGTSTPILLRYNRAGRYAFSFLKNDPSLPEKERTPLSTSWFDKSKIDFDPFLDRPVCRFRFQTPPGTKSIRFPIFGTILQACALSPDGTKVRLNPEMVESRQASLDRAGTSLRILQVEELAGASEKPGLIRLDFDGKNQGIRTVLLDVVPEPGRYGGSVFPEPATVSCDDDGGPIELGDWNKLGILANYSGRAWYSKTVVLTREQLADRVWLDLGDVSASCRVFVNGVEAATLVSPPWTIDVSRFVREGENVLEIQVANTLSNFYSNLPSLYKGDSPSGILGPVRFRFDSAVRLNPVEE